MNFHKAPHTYTGEVHLNVTDLERSTRFYKEVIGFKVLEQVPGKIVLTADGKTPLLIIEQPENVIPKEPRRTGLYHFALLLTTRADLGTAIMHFAENKIPLGASDHKVSEALYLSDPDGNGIEIYADRNATGWEWGNGEVAMTTDPLDAESIVAESAGQSWNGLPEGTVMGHVHLHVADIEQAETFYTALGFEIVAHIPQATFMSTGKYHHHIGMNTWNGKGALRLTPNSTGLRSFTIVYPDDQTLNKAVAKVESLKMRVHANDNGFVTEDPSGNQIILCVR